MQNKKQISVHKFLRVAKNKNSIKVRGLYFSAPFYLSQAIEAYVLGDFIYMWRRCKTKKSFTTKTCFMRYKFNSTEAFGDCVAAGGRVV